jgi:hypothetical protein
MQVRPRGPDKCYSCRAWLFKLRGPVSGHQPIHVMPNVHVINVKPMYLWKCGCAAAARSGIQGGTTWSRLSRTIGNEDRSKAFHNPVAGDGQYRATSVVSSESNNSLASFQNSEIKKCYSKT